jgi:predicted DNA-binding transcriptional regulator AlpA
MTHGKVSFAPRPADLSPAGQLTTAEPTIAREKRFEIGPTYPPRALRAEHAAAYLAMSKASFLRLVEEGTMPPAIKVKGMVVWDRHDLDDAFEELKRRSAKPVNSMDELMGITNGAEDKY